MKTVIVAFLATLLSTTAMAKTGHYPVKHPAGTNVTDLVREVYRDKNLPIIDNIKTLPSGEKRDVTCLALSVYHEARSSTDEDKKGVAHVVINRLKAGDFGKSLCEVVNQRLPHMKVPQFSWLSYRLKSLLPREDESWVKAQKIAWSALKSGSSDPSHGSNYFWNPSKSRVQPWMRGGKAYYRVGSHMYMVSD